jgi:uncharacterized membrane protein YraQ (UPF0718 family)
MSAAKLSTSDRLSLAFSGDLNMLYKEVLAGFLIAGILSAAVPADTWAHLFIADRGGIEQAHWLAAIENALIAPLIAMASFVCSVGNIPLASVLWHNGISFGGVIAFIYSDLLIPPILQLYGKYFGRKLSIYISAIMFATIVITALIVDAVFRAFNFIPAQHSGMAMSAMHIELNYTAYLNMVFLAVCVFLFYKSKKARLAAGAEATKSCCQH